MPIQPKIKIDKENREVFIQIKNAPNATERGIRNAFHLIGKDLVKESRRSILKGPKTGQLYRIKGRKRLHRASAPGQPPANLSGDLRKAIGFQIKGSEEMKFGARSKVDYGRFLELGTKRMIKRPFLLRAIQKLQQRTANYFDGELNKNLNKLPSEV